MTTREDRNPLPGARAISADPLMASAAMDRLLHHSHFLTLESKTFRNPPPDRRPEREGVARPTG